MSAHHRIAHVAIAAFFLLAPLVPEAGSQSSTATNANSESIAQKDFMRSVTENEKQGEYFFYTQSFYDGQNEPVFYQGSIYGAITDVTVDRCRIRINTSITDLFTGTIKKKSIGRIQTVDLSSADFVLAPEITNSLAVVERVPIQLLEGTHPVCPGRRSCAFTWVMLQAEHPVIHETVTTNDIAGYDGFARNFDGFVDHFLIPVNSEDSGRELLSKFRALAGVCGR
jgi:hypothetical protein